MLLLIVCFASLFLVDAQICQRDAGPIVDSLTQCLKSVDFDIENCCYRCPMPDPSGYYVTCNSLYDLGFGSCTQVGAVTAMRTACLNNGGNPDGTDFSCLCNIGSNKSQTTDYVASPTNAPTSAPTNAPTNASSSVIAGVFLSLVLFVSHLFI